MSVVVHGDCSQCGQAVVVTSGVWPPGHGVGRCAPAREASATVRGETVLIPAEQLVTNVRHRRALAAEEGAQAERNRVEAEWTFPCDQCGAPTKLRKSMPGGWVQWACVEHGGEW